MERIKSREAYKEAVKYIPGGVNSPVRALRSVGEYPIFIKQAEGVTLTDIDENTFTDYCLSWGVFIVGHSNPTVNQAAIEAIGRGSSYGIPTEGETQIAKRINAMIPSMEQVRMVSSGTEAVMSAIRLARGYTKREIIVKFDGCYHGHIDHLLVNAGSGVVGLNENSSSAGVPKSFVQHTFSIPFNDQEALERVFAESGENIAAVIVEPVPANMGIVLPKNRFLELLREITLRHGSLLIFDEVITGFRLSSGGAQNLFSIIPDLTTVGKIVGGGFPAAAFGGRRDIMSLLAPNGTVYQAGTLSGNPVAVQAGIATLREISQEGFYEELEQKSSWFYEKLKEAISGKGITINHIASMFTLFFTDKAVDSFCDVNECDIQRFAHFFRYMLTNGVYISPSQFEGNFISKAHTVDHLNHFIELVRNYK